MRFTAEKTLAVAGMLLAVVAMWVGCKKAAVDPFPLTGSVAGWEKTGETGDGKSIAIGDAALSHAKSVVFRKGPLSRAHRCLPICAGCRGRAAGPGACRCRKAITGRRRGSRFYLEDTDEESPHRDTLPRQPTPCTSLASTIQRGYT
jgi:hypothetical protein